MSAHDVGVANECEAVVVAVDYKLQPSAPLVKRQNKSMVRTRYEFDSRLGHHHLL